MRSFKQLAELKHSVGPSDAHILGNGTIRASNSGSYPALTDDPEANVFDWTIDGGRSRVDLLANKFSRITQTHTADLDGDANEDLIVISFADAIMGAGGGRGKLSVFWQTPRSSKNKSRVSDEVPLSERGGLAEMVLLPRAGMIGTTVPKLHDGLLQACVKKMTEQ
ncbi:MAG: hypothetical protein SXG53_10545 [Pseudomonadota bacterium]|nr:hypothetical protein [Pseudomonadota bacterium]